VLKVRRIVQAAAVCVGEIEYAGRTFHHSKPFQATHARSWHAGACALSRFGLGSLGNLRLPLRNARAILEQPNEPIRSFACGTTARRLMSRQPTCHRTINYSATSAKLLALYVAAVARVVPHVTLLCGPKPQLQRP